MIDLDDFNEEQREVVEEAITGGAPPEFARVIARPQLPAEEMKRIMRLIQKGKLEKLPIDFYVRPEFSADKMELMHEWIKDPDLEFAETYASEQLKSCRPYFLSCTRTTFGRCTQDDPLYSQSIRRREINVCGNVTDIVLL